MKKILITLVIIISVTLLIAVSYPLISFYITTIGEKETIIGEVYATYGDSKVYIKSLDDSDKLLLEIKITSDTAFASSGSKYDDDEISELKIGSVVKIDCVYKADLGARYAKKIKTVDLNQKSEWPEIVINNDYSWSQSEIGDYIYGDVVYVVNLVNPIEGWVVYIKDEYGEISGYLLESNNKFLTYELKALLEQKTTGYAVKIHKLYVAPFEKMPITGAFSIELQEE